MNRTWGEMAWNWIISWKHYQKVGFWGAVWEGWLSSLGKEVHFAGTTEVKFRAGGSAKGYIRSQSLSLTSSDPDKATLVSRSTKVSRAVSVSVSGAEDLSSLHLGSLENTGSTCCAHENKAHENVCLSPLIH